LALTRASLWDRRWYRAAVQSRLWLVVPLSVVGVSALAPPAWLWDAVGITALNLAIAFSLDRVMRFPNDFAGRVLNWGPVALVGLASYSVYLWQQFWLDERRDVAFPVNLIAIAVFAGLSYLLVERPLIRVGHRLQLLLARRTARGSS
jgi:peptidoglycan/LPS O-acetylase OafA/YrhL